MHATLAGVALGFLTRPRTQGQSSTAGPKHEVLSPSNAACESMSALRLLEEALHPPTSFVVVPVVAPANAGVRMPGIHLADAMASSVAFGVSIGLLAGKTVDISLYLPGGSSGYRQVAGRDFVEPTSGSWRPWWNRIHGLLVHHRARLQRSSSHRPFQDRHLRRFHRRRHHYRRAALRPGPTLCGGGLTAEGTLLNATIGDQPQLDGPW